MMFDSNSMTFDFIAHLATIPNPQPRLGKCTSTLISGFVDECAEWAHRKKEKARECYRGEVSNSSVSLPDDLRPCLDPELPRPLHEDWIALRISFKLLRPWYARDDRVFHVLDNPLRKDHVFGVPSIPASTWKGLLRWACRMRCGLCQHFEAGKKAEEWHDEPWIVHLFGNEHGEDADFLRGALVLYPTWLPKIDFQVINPHNRSTKAGRRPILYEVVPAEACGELTMLYAPLSGSTGEAKSSTVDALCNLLDATEDLLTKYGFSAKRTAGWGIASITGASARRKEDGKPLQYGSVAELSNSLETILPRLA